MLLSLLLALQSLPCTDPCPGNSVVHVDRAAPGPVHDGQEWSTAYKNLQVALNNTPAGGCIWVAKGDYFTGTGFEIDRSVNLLGGFDGTETCLWQRAGQYQRTVLSGEVNSPAIITDNSDHVIKIVGPFEIGNPPDVVIDGFAIKDAYSLTMNGGGIVCNSAGSLRLENCWIVDNVSGSGGGAWVMGTKLEVLDCTFARNYAEYEGGGLWASAVSSKLVPGEGAHVYNTRIAGNVADNGLGGGVYLSGIEAGKGVLFMNCTVLNNTAPAGGGFGLNAGGKVGLYSTTVSGNGAVTGATIYAVQMTGSQADVFNSIIWQNQPGSTAIDGAMGDFVVEYTALQDGMLFDCTPVPDCVNDPNCTTWSCDPLFAGGLTLQCGSPAVDSGQTNNRPPDVFDVDGDADTTERMPYDMVGDDRVQDGGGGLIIDRGAFETCTP